MAEYVTRTGTQTERPLAVDTVSSPTTVYLRKNIHRATKVDNNTTIEVWEYDEMKLTLAEYEQVKGEMDNPAIVAIREENEVIMQAQAEMFEKQLQIEQNQVVIMEALAALAEK